jgi:hypothetical protein
MASSLSEPTSRRPASARKGVERWTADIERRISAETPRGYDAHEKRFARVPWREIPTRTRALEAHEFVNPTAYVVRASDAFVHPGHFLDKAGVLEADRVVREAKRDAREAATRALAERSSADATLRRETVRARSARASRRHESVVEDIVRPRERDAVTGALIDRSGEYRRLGARDRRLGAPPASGKNAPDAPVAVTFRVLTVHDERASQAHRSSPNAGSVRSTRTRTNDETQKKETASHELKTTRVRESESARRDFTTACSKPHPDFDREQRVAAAATEAERTAGRSIGRSPVVEDSNWPASLSTLMRPRRVTPGERVALVHGPGAAAPSVPSKKTRGARGGALAAKTQKFGYSFAAPTTCESHEDDASNAEGRGPEGRPDESRVRDDASKRATPSLKKKTRRPSSASAGSGPVGPPAPAFAARTATLDERLRWAAARRPASARHARPASAVGVPGARPERDLASRAAIGAGRVPPRALRNPTNAIAVNYPLHEVPDRRPASATPSSMLSRTDAPRPRSSFSNEDRGDARREPRKEASTRSVDAAKLKNSPSASNAARAPHMASSLAELELGSRGASGFPAAFVFGTRRPAKHALEASESVKKFGEFARGFEKHEGAWASEGRIEPRPPTWR